jgi:hypothetical protein
MIRRTLPPLAALLLAACTQTGSPPAPQASLGSASLGSAAVAPAPAGGAGCAGEIGRFRAVIDDDRRTGNIAASVHGRLSGEVDRAASACSAGRDEEALRQLASAKGRYGYR